VLRRLVPPARSTGEASHVVPQTVSAQGSGGSAWITSIDFAVSFPGCF
jgi:hypothetical protein